MNLFKEAKDDFVQKPDNMDERFREIMDTLKATNVALENNNTAFEISMESLRLRDKTILGMGRLLENKDEQIAELKERVGKTREKKIETDTPRVHCVTRSEPWESPTSTSQRTLFW